MDLLQPAKTTARWHGDFCTCGGVLESTCGLVVNGINATSQHWQGYVFSVIRPVSKDVDLSTDLSPELVIAFVHVMECTYLNFDILVMIGCRRDAKP